MGQYQSPVRFPYLTPIARVASNYARGITDPPTTQSKNEPKVQPHIDPLGATSPSNDGKPPAPPQQGSSKEGWAAGPARGARKMFKAIVKKFREI